MRFAREYLVDFNATKAAIRVGLSEKTAYSTGPRMLENAEVRAEIDRLMEEEAGIPKVAIVNRLALIAFANAGEFFEWGPDGVTIKNSKDLTEEQRAIISEVSETRTETGGTIRVKLSDSQAALDKLARVFGMYRDRLDIKDTTHEDDLDAILGDDP